MSNNNRTISGVSLLSTSNWIPFQDSSPTQVNLAVENVSVIPIRISQELLKLCLIKRAKPDKVCWILVFRSDDYEESYPLGYNAM
jgi:hypothetical protein